MSGDGGSLDVSVTRTRADYREALVQAFLRGKGLAVSGLIGLIAAGYVFFTGIASANINVLAESAMVGTLAFAVIALLGLTTALITAGRVCALPGAFEPLHCSFSDQMVEFSRSSGSSTVLWEVWRSALETRNLFILFSKMGSVHVLPKRDLTTDQSMRLRILLNDKLGDGAGVFVEHRA